MIFQIRFSLAVHRYAIFPNGKSGNRRATIAREEVLPNLAADLVLHF